MKLPELKIGNLIAKLPIMQGGMATMISTSRLAAAVANEGGIGIIAATGMSTEELKNEIRNARKLSKNGIIGINCLFAYRHFSAVVKAALEEGIDLVVSGAGFSRDMFKWGKDYDTPIVPIVSSVRLAKTAEKMGATAIVVEGKEAGGHLGTDRSIKEIFPEIRRAVPKATLLAAGGIVDAKDIYEALQMGADGVQMGTRFAASVESNASDDFKQMYIEACHDDVVLINSPVGLSARGLRNIFTEKLEKEGQIQLPKPCDSCLKKCSRSFCIMDSLYNAQKEAAAGGIERATVFCGENVEKIKEILSVKEIIDRIKKEFALLPLGRDLQ